MNRDGDIQAEPGRWLSFDEIVARTSPVLGQLAADPFADRADEATGAAPVILDASAVVAVLTRESDGSNLRDLIYDAEVVRISAAGYLERQAVVLDSRGLGRRAGPNFLEWCAAGIKPVTESQGAARQTILPAVRPGDRDIRHD